GHYSDGSNAPLTGGLSWSSSAPGVATVSATGLATGIAAGSTTITATHTATGISGSASLQVTGGGGPDLVMINVAPGTASIAVGGTQQYTATGIYSDRTTQNLTPQVSWSSSAPSVATVSAGGLATGVAAGSTTITATLSGISGSASLQVTGGEPPTLETITLAPTSASIVVGATQQFSATGHYSDGTSAPLTTGLSWSSSAPGVATVNASGLATGIAAGSTTIMATHTATGISGSASLEVTEIVTGSYWTTEEIPVDPVTLASGILDVTVPEPAAAIGIAVEGSNTNYKVIDHGIFLQDGGGNPLFITDPNGDPVPLAFNFIDTNGDGQNEDFSVLYDREATALFFPNDGTLPTLPAGTYHFPLASFNASGTALQSDTLQPYVYFKVPTTEQTTLKVNLFVISGVGGITTATQAQNDPEIQGAIAVLQNVYESNANTLVHLDINVAVIPDSSFAIIESDAEVDALFSGYPTTPTHDAVNLFVISQLSYLPSGVVGFTSRIPGPFTRQGTIQSGTVMEYQGDNTGEVLGVVLAHELGHYLGLWHTSQTNSTATGIIGEDPIADTPVCTNAQIGSGGINACPDRTNLMFPYVSPDANPPVSVDQGTVILLNPAVRLP
ncbi:MAG TPA: Ig-like domain-containing protein, partial [bacterium]|nr:Ig-like domain-containing protein [bacterium]